MGSVVNLDEILTATMNLARVVLYIFTSIVELWVKKINGLLVETTKYVYNEICMILINKQQQQQQKRK